MKRTWYGESFDQKNVVHVPDSQAADLAAEALTHEFEEKKKQAFSNIIEFAIGVILLTFCRYYLQTHPAEKVSLFSGIEVMRQKTTFWLTNMSAEDTALFEKKQQLEKTFQEIVLLSTENTCVDQPTRSAIAESFQRLQAMDIQSFEQQQSAFATVIGVYYTKVKSDCAR